MDFVEQYRWIFIIIGVIFFFKLFGKSKGGTVVSQVTAELQIHDPQFQACRPKAKYVIFKESKPHKIDIEVENLPLQAGNVLDFYINRKLLSRVQVERNHEAEFEHWSDGNVNFPQINAGDKLDIVFQNNIIISGVFQ